MLKILYSRWFFNKKYVVCLLHEYLNTTYNYNLHLCYNLNFIYEITKRLQSLWMHRYQFWYNEEIYFFVQMYLIFDVQIVELTSWNSVISLQKNTKKVAARSAPRTKIQRNQWIVDIPRPAENPEFQNDRLDSDSTLQWQGFWLPGISKESIGWCHCKGGG